MLVGDHVPSSSTSSTPSGYSCSRRLLPRLPDALRRRYRSPGDPHCALFLSVCVVYTHAMVWSFRFVVAVCVSVHAVDYTTPTA